MEPGFARPVSFYIVSLIPVTYLFQDPADEASLLDNCVSQMKAYMEHLKNNDSGCVQSNLFMRIFSAYINQDPFFRNFRNITDLCFLHSDLLFYSQIQTNILDHILKHQANQIERKLCSSPWIAFIY